MSTILRLKNGFKKYGIHIIFSNLNLSLKEKKITVLHGPSGIGKTTLLKCLCLLETLDSGTLELNGKIIANGNKNIDEQYLRNNIGIVFQDFYLWDNKTVLANITEALIHVKKIPKHEAVAIANKLTNDLQINKEHLNKYPPDLSRGQRQRVAIARTLATNPQIILLDEPTASLDEAVIKELIKMLRILKEKGKTIFIVNHDPSFGKSIGDTILNFKDLQK